MRLRTPPGRKVKALGLNVRLLPAKYVRAYVKRNKTDAADGAAAKQSNACTKLLSVPGVGLLTATAIVAATGGSVTHFRSARHFASWFGLTPK